MDAGKPFKEEEKCHLEAHSRFLKCLQGLALCMGPSILRGGLEGWKLGAFPHIQVRRTREFKKKKKRRKGISVGRERHPDFILFTKTVTHEVQIVPLHLFLLLHM